MFKIIGGLAGCVRGRHERSEKSVRKVDGQYVGVCSYCRTPMKRLGKRNWIANRAAP